MRFSYLKELVKDYNQASETEEWDIFIEKWGDYDEILYRLISYIEKEIL